MGRHIVASVEGRVEDNRAQVRLPDGRLRKLRREIYQLECRSESLDPQQWRKLARKPAVEAELSHRRACSLPPPAPTPEVADDAEVVAVARHVAGVVVGAKSHTLNAVRNATDCAIRADNDDELCAKHYIRGPPGSTPRASMALRMLAQGLRCAMRLHGSADRKV